MNLLTVLLVGFVLMCGLRAGQWQGTYNEEPWEAEAVCPTGQDSLCLLYVPTDGDTCRQLSARPVAGGAHGCHTRERG